MFRDTLPSRCRPRWTRGRTHRGPLGARGPLAALIVAVVSVAQAEPPLTDTPPNDAPVEEGPNSAPTPVVVPPTLLHFVEAPYPAAALRERRGAEVVLRLDIDAVGRVADATVHTTGGVAFDTAALAAARQFVFTPAVRDGRHVAARILYTYRFEPPIESAAAAATEAPAVDDVEAADPALQAMPPAEPVVVDVIVEGEREQQATEVHSVSAEELRRVPGTMGDALRAIQSLPGVAQTPSVSGLLIVRGTPSESTQVFFDGVLTPQLYHFGGLSSVVPTDMIESIDFHPGNFDAEFGRGVGGIVDAKFRSPRGDALHAMAQLDLIDARAMVEGPIPNGDGWRLMAGARRSHVDAWLGPLLAGTNTRFNQLPVYFDYQLIAERQSRNGDQLRVGVYGADDAVRLLSNSSVFFSDFRQHNAFWNVFSEYRSQLSNATSWQHVISFGHLLERIRIGPLAADTIAYPMVFRGTLSHRLSKALTLRVGPDMLAAPFRVRLAVTEEDIVLDPLGTSAVLRPPRLGNSQSAFFQPGAFATLDARLGARLKVSPGMRLDYTRGTDRWDMSPRLNASYAVASAHPRTTLKAGAGLYYEPPEVRFTLPEYGSADLRSHRSAQISLGVDQDLTRQLEASVEGFYSHLDRLLSRGPDARGVAQYNNEGEGRVYGAELLLRYEPDEVFFGWLSYTLSRAERRLVPGAPMDLYDFDQTHIGSVLGGFRLGAGWQLGGRFRLVSGNPYNPCEQEIYSASEGQFRCLLGGRGKERGPWFHQLDLRLEKRWQPSQALAIDTYLDVINVYNRSQADLPFVPSFGVRVEL